MFEMKYCKLKLFMLVNFVSQGNHKEFPKLQILKIKGSKIVG